METLEKPSRPKSGNSRNMLLAVMVGQVGILTLIIVIAATIGGLALDRALGTKPWFTIGLLIVSVPVSIVLMVLIARKTVSKIRIDDSNTPVRKEDEIGKDS